MALEFEGSDEYSDYDDQSLESGDEYYADDYFDIKESIASPGGKNHEYLVSLFDIDESDQKTFMTLLCLCDPKTQPQEPDDYVLSLDVLTDVFIGILFLLESNNIADYQGDDGNKLACIKFTMSIQLYKILLQILQILGPSTHTEIEIIGTVNVADWEYKVDSWAVKLPLRTDDHNLKVTYLMVCVLLNTLRKLFPDECNDNDFNLAKNPYTPKFVELFKVYSRIVFHCLQIDQFLEIQSSYTPNFIIQILKGSSLVRHVLAYILNYSRNFNPNDQLCLVDDDYYHDIHNESLLAIYSPVIRQKIDGGSLMKHMAYYTLLQYLITAGAPTLQLTDINEAKIFMNDKLDEDLRYIFEYDDADEETEEHENHENLEIDNEDQAQSETNEIAQNHTHTHDDNTKGIRSKGFNYQRDYLYDAKKTTGNNGQYGENDDDDDQEDEWIDRPRGSNVQINLELLALAHLGDKCGDYAYRTASEFKKNLLLVILYPQPVSPNDEKYHTIARRLLRTVAGRIVAPEYFTDEFSISEYLFSEVTNEALVNRIIEKNLITPVLRVKNFELLLVTNPELALLVFDELLMEEGQRRMHIWVLCHEINLSNNYLDYIFQLLTEQRNVTLNLPFSRAGNAVILTDLEKSMIIHEFLEGAHEFLSASDGINTEDGYQVILSEAVCNKYVIVICLMVDKLIDKGVITESSYANLHVIIRFLFDFINKVPQARKTYFRITVMSSNATNTGAKPLTQYINETLLEIGKDHFTGVSTDDVQEIYRDKITDVLQLLTDFYCNNSNSTIVPKKTGSEILLLTQIYLDALPILSTHKFFINHIIKRAKAIHSAQRAMSDLFVHHKLPNGFAVLGEAEGQQEGVVTTYTRNKGLVSDVGLDFNQPVSNNKNELNNEPTNNETNHNGGIPNGANGNGPNDAGIIDADRNDDQADKKKKKKKKKNKKKH